MDENNPYPKLLSFESDISLNHIIKGEDQDRAFLNENSLPLSYLEFKKMVLEMEKVLHHILTPKKVAVVSTKAPLLYALCLALWKRECEVLILSPHNTPKEISTLKEDFPMELIFTFAHDPFEGSLSTPICEIPIYKNSFINGLSEIENDYFNETFAPQKAAIIIGTSGSQGKSKPVKISLKAFLYSALGTLQFYSFTEEDSWALTLPLNHVGGFMVGIRTLLGGGETKIRERTSLFLWILKERPNFISLVPAQLIEILEEIKQRKLRPTDLHFFKGILVGGGKTPHWALELAKSYTLPLSPTYGMTESSSQVLAIQPEDFKAQNLNEWRPKLLPFRKFQLASDGTIQVGGETLFEGYYQRGELVSTRAPGQFFSTQDLGKMNTQGTLAILGRKDEVIICGGQNISPKEIEGLASKNDGIIQTKTIPFPHKSLGSIPVLILDLKKDFDLKSLKRDIREGLPAYKRPKMIISNLEYPNLPKGPLGKFQKEVLIKWIKEEFGEEIKRNDLEHY